MEKKKKEEEKIFRNNEQTRRGLQKPPKRLQYRMREIPFLPFLSKTILQTEKCKKICAKEQLMENNQKVILYKWIFPQSRNVFELYLLIFLKNIRNLISYFFFLFFLELYNTNAYSRFAFVVQKCYVFVQINYSGFVVQMKKISLTYCTLLPELIYNGQ